jgi:hypothetical protein
MDFITMAYDIAASVIEFLSKSVPIQRLCRRISASPSQCLFAASAVEFLQVQAYAPQRVSVARGFHSLPKH